MREPVQHAKPPRALVAVLGAIVAVAAIVPRVDAAEKARPAAEPAAAANPDDEIMKSNLPDAVKAERKLMRKPSDRKARIDAAKANLAQGADEPSNVDAAQAHVLAVLAENPNDVESLLLAGQTSLLKSDLQAAARYYRAATLVAPDNASAFLGLGDALTRLRDEPGANAAFERFRALKGMAPLPKTENTK
jgi:cytochrome c-type biogenesis protein CcmH/NrfG